MDMRRATLLKLSSVKEIFYFNLCESLATEPVKNMKCGLRSCRVMLNYRLISVSAITLYVFIRIHVESFNDVSEPCLGETRLRQYVAWVSRV